MQFIDLKKNLEKKIYNVYFIEGEDRALMQKAENILLHKIVNTAPELNLQVFESSEFSMQEVLENAQTFPFASEYRMLLIKNAPAKLLDADQKLFDNYLSNIPPQTVMVFVFDEKTNFFQKYASKVEVVDCAKLSQSFLTKYVSALLNKKGKHITIDAISLFLEYCDNDLAKIENECEKLSNSVEEDVLNKSHIMENVSKSVDYQIFELTQEICNKNAVRTFEIFNYLMDKKVSTQMVLGLLFSTFRRMFYSNVALGTDAEIAGALGVKPYSVTISRKNSANFKKVELKDALEKCLACDNAIKQGHMNDKTALNLLLLDLLK